MAQDTTQQPDIDSLPKGLLSFIYNVLYNDAVHEKFFADVKTLMNSFELTKEEQEAILASMDQGTATPEDAKIIGALLAKELEDHFTAYYEEFW